MRDKGNEVARGLMALASLSALCIVCGGAAGYALYRPIRAITRPAAPQSAPPRSWVGKRLPTTSQWTLEGAPWAGIEPGRPSVLVFWSTECAFCLEEISELSSLHTLLDGQVQMVGLPVQTDVDLIACVASRKGVGWPQLRGEPGGLINPLAVALDVRRIPSLWLLDGDGIIRAERLERIEDLRDRLAEVLAGRR